ncbi:adhesion G protein-coupled receptor A3 isoform X2 [Leptopilina heterotoma]|uniref:adhesion G protein-coupled receptor A3 isoform X2 n=1 Tax=Leptopilina heterotoma TaxID=63436 RepID=UPI001CA962E5|nr:adhesion G protein-coupled receptor A3 isoform X2 [Leptopilina heterotoma]
MITAIVILILMQGFVSSQPCPHRCECKRIGPQAELLKVICNDHIQQIKEIALDTIGVEIFQIDLNKNDIYIIEPNIFINLTYLKRLSISYNKITTLAEGSFNGLENLERLDLNHNQISTIDTYAFKQLINLKRLDLSFNRISKLGPTLFHSMVVLDRLKLNDNYLTTLKEGTFHRLKSLKQLDVSNNPWNCNCDLYWFSSWINNSTLKLNSPKCATPLNLKDQAIRKLKLTDGINCEWSIPALEVLPHQNQIVFAGDSLTLRCRAPTITDTERTKILWFWNPNITTNTQNSTVQLNPNDNLSNVKIENRRLTESGLVDSSLIINPVREEHTGQWNCLLASVYGNKSKTINVIVISNSTRYCPQIVTRNNKGTYMWPRTVLGWKVELPCEGSVLSSLLQNPLLATYHCNTTGNWENLNTEQCPYVSPTTKILEQFSKVNLSLTKTSLMETVKKFKNYTGDSVTLTDPVEIKFITQTIENYLSFLIEEKELGTMLIDIINVVLNLPKRLLKMAEISYKSCTKLIKSVEKITELTPAIQSHKNNMALEEIRIKPESFVGLMCSWYKSINPDEKRELYCTINNKTAMISMKEQTIEASVQLPASLFSHFEDKEAAYQLMISMYSNSRLFPKIIDEDNMDISSCIIGSKILGRTVNNLTDPVYVMLKTPLHHYNSKLIPVIWDSTTNGTGKWSSDGCELLNLINNLIVFHCNRLGYYGLLQDVSYLDKEGGSLTGAMFKYSNPAVYVGSFITIICLVIITVTYVCCYPSIAMPKKAKHCVINTWIALTLLCILYIAGIQQTENIEICQGVGLVLHYLSLSSLLWMAATASNMYKRISKSDMENLPDDEIPEPPIRKPLLGLYLVGWGISLIICGLSGAINLREYASYSHCFLSSRPSLAAIFMPAAILFVYLVILHLLIRCTIRNTDLNGQLSEGTQATENMDLELLEPNANPIIDRASLHSSQTVSSEVEDSEHSQITQLKGQIIIMFLYLITWTFAALTSANLFASHISYEETLFAVLYAISASSLGIFILFFYGIARNDVRSQWSVMRCWLKKRKHRCCRPRGVSDAVSPVPTQPLATSIPAPFSNTQATQVTSDTNSLSSSRNTNKSQTSYNMSKLVDATAVNPPEMANVKLIMMHRQQYRSNNSVTTYNTECQPACVEMFYNPHQSGVARKFFKRQRKHTKNNNLGPRKQGDGGVTSDGGSCISLRRTMKLDNDIGRSILSGGTKVNNTNIHVEMNPINDLKNVNILSDSGQSSIVTTKKINRDSAQRDSLDYRMSPSRDFQHLHQEHQSTVSTSPYESDTGSKTEEKKQLRNASQQCSLECSSDMDSIVQMTSEKSEQNFSEIDDMLERPIKRKTRCSSFIEPININDEKFRSDLKKSSYSCSMYTLPTDCTNSSKSRSHRNSTRDAMSLASSKNCEYSKSSYVDSFSSNSHLQEKMTTDDSRESLDSPFIQETYKSISDNDLVRRGPISDLLNSQNCPSNSCADPRQLEEMQLTNFERKDDHHSRKIGKHFYSLSDLEQTRGPIGIVQRYQDINASIGIDYQKENYSDDDVATLDDDCLTPDSLFDLSNVKKETSV